MESEFAVRHAVRRSLCTLYLQEDACEQISRVTRENVWLPWVGAEAICSQALREHPSSHWGRRAQQRALPDPAGCVPRGRALTLSGPRDLPL